MSYAIGLHLFWNDLLTVDFLLLVSRSLLVFVDEGVYCRITDQDVDVFPRSHRELSIC